MASPHEISRALRTQFGAVEATVQLSEILKVLESYQQAYEETVAARQQQRLRTPQAATATATATALTTTARQQQHPRPRLPQATSSTAATGARADTLKNAPQQQQQ